MIAKTLVRCPSLFIALSGGKGQALERLIASRLSRPDGTFGMAELMNKPVTLLHGENVALSLQPDGVVCMDAGLVGRTTGREAGLTVSSFGRLSLKEVLPETVMLATVGRDLRDVVDHPWLKSEEGTIVSNWSSQGALVVDFSVKLIELGGD